MKINSTLLKIIKDLQRIPSTPFTTKQQANNIENYLKRCGYNYENNGFSIIVNTASKSKRPKLVLMSHTDHPGFVLANNKEGVLFGTGGSSCTKRLVKVLKDQNVPIKVFDPNGTPKGKGFLSALYGKYNQKAKFNINFEVQANSTAQYDFLYFKESEDHLKLYNADDAICVAIMLYLLEQKIKTKFNLYYVFNLYEEVHQISAWHLAKYNTFNLTQNDYVLNLERLKIENVLNRKYTNANYKGGVTLQLANTGCLFGYKSKSHNLTETIVKKVCKDEKIPLQIGVIKDSCDSRPFSYFGITPNIATLTIPNEFKHNENRSGQIVPETILKKDVNDLIKIIKGVITTDPDEITVASNIKNLSYEIKQKDDVTNPALMKSKGLLNERLEVYYSPVIKRGYYYPETVSDFIKDKIAKMRWIATYISHIFLKFNI